ncbi:MAG: hypothetical protein M1837_003065 [Sclerophora amabilis]|nr:MAG: hypothetical protein M1837_003065 [Sclerophora amabilis]
MLFSRIAAPALITAISVGFADGFWRLSCNLIQTGRIDPVVNPGRTSGHVHKISGASNINIDSTYESLQKASCTSCSVQADKSAYWTPMLYYQYADGSFQDVPNNGMAIYYLGRGDDKANLRPFPPGFRMLSGSPGLRSYDSSTLMYRGKRPVADRVSFACLDGTPSKELNYMGKTDCKDGLRAQIHFQSCWNGKDLYLADNSHVAYMSGLDNGQCPPTHPVPLVHLFYEVLYSVNQIKKENGGRFVFAQGDTTGYGFHGDFLNGWDNDTLTKATRECANTNSPAVEDCAALKVTNDKKAGQNCPPRPPIIQEQTTGRLPRLPGCITVTSGPGRASISDMNCANGSTNPPADQPPIPPRPLSSSLSSASSASSSTTLRTSTTRPSSSTSTTLGTSTTRSSGSTSPTATSKPPNPASPWVYLGCASETTPRALTGASFANDNMTPKLCQAFCEKSDMPLSGTEYGRECYCGAALPPNSRLDQSGCTKPCKGDASSTCGGSNRLSVFKLSNFVAPAVVPRVGAYRSLGCYTEGLNGARAFSGGASYTNATNMTVANCVGHCSSKGFAYAGLEYARECYCGAGPPGQGAKPASDQTQCGMLCTGDKKAYCGGSQRLNVYSKNAG